MQIMYLLFWFFLSTLAYIAEHTIQSNNPPKVTLLMPDGKTPVNNGVIIPYKIEVRDAEDGFSGYDEIQRNEVFMKIGWISDSKKLAAYEAKEKKSENIYRLIAINGCVNCHSFSQKLAGPSFEQITKKYASEKNSISILAEKIRNGSKGVWGDTQQMPGHPSITQEEAQSIVTWIYEHSKENHFQYLAGLEGAIQLNATSKPTNGFYVLTASYTDHGLNGKDYKTASHSILLPVGN
jgi:cytochrome c551/c552